MTAHRAVAIASSAQSIAECAGLNGTISMIASVSMLQIPDEDGRDGNFELNATSMSCRVNPGVVHVEAAGNYVAVQIKAARRH